MVAGSTLFRVGLIENRDIILDVAWVTGDPDQAVSDVLRRGAELLIPCGSSASVAAKRQTTTIPVHKKKDLRVELRAAADLALPALFWGKAGWRVSASWKIILISQGVKRKKSQPATTSSRCREVHIFLRRGDEGSARPFQHARTLHDVAIVPLAMASARWASPTPDNSLSRRPRRGCHSRRKHLMHGRRIQRTSAT
jgi:hypothetical protein